MNLIKLSLLFIVLILASCSTVKKRPVDLDVKPDLTQVETSHKRFLVVSKFTGFSSKTEERLKKAVIKVDEVFHSQCFEDFMVAREKGEHSDKYVLHSTNGLTAKEVVQDLRTNQATVELIYYYKRFSKVHGYTYPNVNWIKLNGKYHTGTTICSEASNLGHEGSHKIKYGHSYKSNSARPFSVPYSINKAFKVCCIEN